MLYARGVLYARTKKRASKNVCIKQRANKPTLVLNKTLILNILKTHTETKKKKKFQSPKPNLESLKVTVPEHRVENGKNDHLSVLVDNFEAHRRPPYISISPCLHEIVF